MQCPNCGTANDDFYRFCIRCGSPLPAQPPAAPEGDKTVAAVDASQPPVTPPAYVPPEPIPAQPVYPPPGAPAYTPPEPPVTPPPYAPPPSQVYPPAVQQPVYPPPMPPQGSGAYTPPQVQPGYPPAVPPQGPYAPYGQPPQTGQGAFNLWGPFVGYGSRRRHVGWLMDNRGDCAEELTRKVGEKFRERQIPEALLGYEVLTAQGLVVEKRPYFILRRSLASVALYITRFGKDLFVSLASYLKPPISNLRIVVLVVSVLFFLYSTFIFPASLASSFSGMFGGGLFGGGGGASAGLMTLICLVGPLGSLNTILLFIFLLYSLYKWLTIKDFWAGLRVAPNEFNEDDLMAMEKAVEQTVRMSIDQIGLDPNDLRPAGSGLDAARLI